MPRRLSRGGCDWSVCIGIVGVVTIVTTYLATLPALEGHHGMRFVKLAAPDVPTAVDLLPGRFATQSPTRATPAAGGRRQCGGRMFMVHWSHVPKASLGEESPRIVDVVAGGRNRVREYRQTDRVPEERSPLRRRRRESVL